MPLAPASWSAAVPSSRCRRWPATPGASGYTDTLQATGSGSKLSLPVLATIAGETTNYYSWTQVEALAGGDVECPVLTQISGGPVLVESDGPAEDQQCSTFPDLASFSGQVDRDNFSTLQASNGGTVLDRSLTTLSLVNLPLDSTATLAVSQITSFTGGTLTFSAGTLSLPVLADIDGSTFELSAGVSLSLPEVTGATGSSFLVSGGAPLTLPALASYAGGVGYADTLQATGSGSKLSLPALATITGETTNYYSWTQVQALAGGDVELPVLTQISGGPVLLESDGSSGESSCSTFPTWPAFRGKSTGTTSRRCRPATAAPWSTTA